VKEQKEKPSDEETLRNILKYRESGDVSVRNRIVMEHIYIPKISARNLRGLASGYAQTEDMVEHGVITLMDCIDKYDPSKGVAFEAYAFIRIRGAILDLVRKQDWIPRRVRDMSKEIMKAYSELANQQMGEPTQQQIADKLGITVEQLDTHNAEMANSVTMSFEELLTSQSDSEPEATGYDDIMPERSLMKTEMQDVLTGAVDTLGERERLIVTLYYYEDLQFNEIAEVMGITAQRVSQIHSKAIMKLKKVMEEYIGE
jgi:RNA polymerase sigma factor for flagellar operon FliA